MQIELKSPLVHGLSYGLMTAALALGGVAAHAAGGYTVTHAQESAVRAGLSAEEVRQALGRPAHVERFVGEAGPIWTYNVSGGLDPMAVFEVDFGADGKVATVNETVIQVD